MLMHILFGMCDSVLQIGVLDGKLFEFIEAFLQQQDGLNALTLHNLQALPKNVQISSCESPFKWLTDCNREDLHTGLRVQLVCLRRR